MAQRYGGTFSPGGGTPPRPTRSGNPFRGGRVARARARVNLLFLAPLPLVVTAFAAGPVGMALDLAALGMLLLAAWLLRDGLKAEDAYNARQVARRPAIPRKSFATALTGLGIALAAHAPGAGLTGPMVYGTIGAFLHLFAFGIDPLRHKGMDGFDAFSTERVARAVDEAESHLAAMSEAVARAGDRPLEARVARFQATAREMFRTIERDPRDLSAARRYLGVYLIGARDAAEKFAALHAATRDPAARADFATLLDDLETNFAAQTQKLLLDDKTDLDVEIEVLRERLQREGVRQD